MERPFVTVKFAQTLDGKIAARNGSSKWISGPKSRIFSHRLRSENDAILVGIGTVVKDNPELTTRYVEGKSPARVIIDPKLKVPLRAEVLKRAQEVRTIIITTKRAPKKKLALLGSCNVECAVLPVSGSAISVKKILRSLYDKGIRSVLVEGGAKVITSFLRSGTVDRLVVIVSPKIVGEGRSAVGDLGISDINKAIRLSVESTNEIDEDIVYTARINNETP